MSAQTNAVQKFTVAAGCALRVADTGGDKCPLVLLHGYLESLDVWDDFIPLLSDTFRVIAPDLPGAGVSQVKGPVHTMEFEADIIAALLEKLGIRSALVAGHSMGGYVALELVRKYPEKVAGIVLLHSTPNADTAQKKADRIREEEIVAAGKKELLASTPAKGFAPENRSRFSDQIAELAEGIALADDEGITALLRGMRERRDLNEMLRLSRTPQLFVFGCKDEYITVDTAQNIAAAHPQAEVVWLPRSGHMGFMEEPAQTAAAIEKFGRKACPESGL